MSETKYLPVREASVSPVAAPVKRAPAATDPGQAGATLARRRRRRRRRAADVRSLRRRVLIYIHTHTRLFGASLLTLFSLFTRSLVHAVSLRNWKTPVRRAPGRA